MEPFRNRIILVLLLMSGMIGFVPCHKTFFIPFQPILTGTFSPSTNEWIEFTNKIPNSKEFTACHWIRTKYFNMDISVMFWQYCTTEFNDDVQECIELYLDKSPKTANRDVVMKAHIRKSNYDEYIGQDVHEFKHRTWTFFCWTASSITMENKFYYNGDLIGSIFGLVEKNQNLLKDSTDKYKSEFIFGQMKGTASGKFQQFKSLIGDMAEFNLWNYTLNDLQVRDISQCKLWESGNVIRWKKNEIVTHRVLFKNLRDGGDLCHQKHNLVMFPEKLTLYQAKRKCAAHGGSLVVPYSNNENSLVMKVVKKHKGKCTDKSNSMDSAAIWLGAKKVKYHWYEVNLDDTLGKRLNYTNLVTKDTGQISESYPCSMLKYNGLWQVGEENCFARTSLCTVCSIENTPVFTIKGTCYASKVDYNYYMSLDMNNQLEYFEGYKDTNLVMSNDSGWETKPKNPMQDKSYEWKLYPDSMNKAYPVGRRIWSIRDDLCGQTTLQKTTIALSVCDVRTKFTCDDGICVDQQLRCDGNIDCDDKSDEKGCRLIEFPISYRKENAPKSTRSDMNDLFLGITVVHIDKIDTLNM